jgi:hypothetical protein
VLLRARAGVSGAVASTPAINERRTVVRRRGVRGNRSELGMAWRERPTPIYRGRRGRERGSVGHGFKAIDERE